MSNAISATDEEVFVAMVGAAAAAAIEEQAETEVLEVGQATSSPQRAGQTNS